MQNYNEYENELYIKNVLDEKLEDIILSLEKISDILLSFKPKEKEMEEEKDEAIKFGLQNNKGSSDKKDISNIIKNIFGNKG